MSASVTVNIPGNNGLMKVGLIETENVSFSSLIEDAPRRCQVSVQCAPVVK
jgi:hypothetical protein